jgi:hypothetical protein
MPTAISRTEKVFLKVQTDPLIVPNTAGVADLASTDSASIISTNLNENREELTDDSKTGTLDEAPGEQGRASASFEIRAELKGGAPGAPALPNLHQALQSVFGNAGTVIAGGNFAISAATNTSPIVVTCATGHGLVNGDVIWIDGVTGNTGANGAFCVSVAGNNLTLLGSSGTGAYVSGGTVRTARTVFTLGNATPTFTLYSFLAAVRQHRFMAGCMARTATWNFGGSKANLTIAGRGLSLIQKPNWDLLTSEERFGLSDYPAVPIGTLAQFGPITPGYKGGFFAKDKRIVQLRNGSVSIDTGTKPTDDGFGQDFPTQLESETGRRLSLNFTADIDDSDAMYELIRAAKSREQFRIIQQMGNRRWGTHVMVMNNSLVGLPSLEEATNMRFNFQNIRAYPTNLGGLDGLTYTIL